MTLEGTSHLRREPPAGYDRWWSTDLQLWWRDIDGYGHLTATGYPVMYGEAIGRLVSAAWRQHEPDFVVAELQVAYLREVCRQDGPVRVYVGIARVGRASFVAEMVLCASDGGVCSTSRVRHVAWDPERRGARALTTAEREALVAASPAAVRGGGNR
ncbi:thioesterase family protein [Nocardioides sp. LS1]|uniref:acyl-CoA thioesterase n=1 Tax=Nocardioides sp. LS1 TaxID=1027620 RepID=UPI000F6228AF|nr:acyl-CoA thioesterase [Nocardioides sp. LS1]GCD88129.1 hypothetical protein NLS1_01350 [Nocardioides sp. LS1]